MSASCHVANILRMTYCPDTCWHVGEMSGMSAQHWEKMSSQTAKRYVNKTSFKIFWLNLLDVKKKQQSFAENCTVMVWFSARKSRVWYCMHHFMYTYHFSLKNDRYLRWSNGHTSHGYGWEVVRQHISQHVTQPHPVTALATFGIGRFLADNVGIAAIRVDMSLTFPTKGIVTMPKIVSCVVTSSSEYSLDILLI